MFTGDGTNLSVIFKDTSREKLPELEDTFLREFYTLAGQTYDPATLEHFLCTSASMVLEIVANYARLNQQSVTLIEPCFDNLADIFRRHKVSLTPLPDEVIACETLDSYLVKDTSSAICIVSPNNPTGTTLTPKDLAILVEHCEKTKKLLIIDSSFRHYHPGYTWDQYGILRESSADYLVIEDTGKTWPTQELKLGILAASTRLQKDMYLIYTDMLLHVSPFIVTLLTECVKHSQKLALADVRKTVQENRKTLYAALQGTILTPCEQPFMSVSWLQVAGGYTASQVQKNLAAANVYLLPGTYFYWSERPKGERYLRVALARDQTMFREASAIMRKSLLDMVG